jgi:predicted transposase/invertase (TIGR01784 family)
LLTVLLGKQIRIKSLLESESNKETESDKFNRVDILAEDEKGELMIFEIQNNRELDYFHRMAYGTSKVLSEYLKEGEPYDMIRKVYSINIVYFSLGQGEDYAYHGTTQFVSMHDENDILKLSAAQRKAFGCDMPSDVFPEYYLLRVDKFDKLATTPLDEWISFLKTSEIPVTFNAPGLPEARERLRVDSLTDEEKKDYHRMMENLRYQRSVIKTGREEGRAEGREEGREEGRKEGAIQIAQNMKKEGLPISLIAKMTGLSEEEIKKL